MAGRAYGADDFGAAESDRAWYDEVWLAGLQSFFLESGITHWKRAGKNRRDVARYVFLAAAETLQATSLRQYDVMDAHFP